MDPAAKYAYWAAAGVVVLCAAAAVVATLLGRRAQLRAYRAGYWRGSYEQLTGLVTTREIRSGWQPSPWDDFPPPPPWEDQASPPRH